MNNKYETDEFSVRPNPNDLSGRQGIALVVVLGFLAVLTIMAVGMAISMRTERLASRSYLDMVRARFLCQAGLADAVLHIEEAADLAARNGESGGRNRFMPDFAEYLQMTPEGAALVEHLSGPVYMRNDAVLPSLGSDDVFTNSLISGLATNWIPYIPGLLWRTFYTNEKYGSEALRETAKWLHVTNSTTGEVDGRFMYLAFNASGRYDINYFDRELAPSNHNMEVNWRRLQSLQRFPYQDREDVFDGAVRFESCNDLPRELTRHGGNLTDWSIAGETPWEIETFSYFPPMRRIELDGNRLVADEFDKPAFLSTSFDELEDSRDDIISAFQTVIDLAQWKDAEEACSAEELYGMLIDYVDEDFEPWKLDAPSIEAVPLINEFMIASNRANVEIWMPFVGGTHYQERFKVSVELDGQLAASQFIGVPSWSETPPDPYAVQIDLATALSNQNFNAIISVLGDSGQVFDRIEFGNVELDEFWQCDDPRFNHLRSQWVQGSSGSLGAVNSNAEYKDTPGAGGYLKDGDYLMYCANRDLRCTGELGYLPAAPWRTLKLYQDPRENERNMDPVLDFFTMFPSDGVMHGMMNPNEKYHYQSHAVATFETDSSKGNWGLYPEQQSSFTEYRTIPHSLTNTVNEFINISDMGAFLYRNGDSALNSDWVAGYKNKDAAAYSELRMEHMMRRASALCHVRQNLYIICIWAQTLGAPADGDRDDWASYPIKAEAQAVAMVWRDPYPASDGSHPAFVRYMRWME